MAIVTLRYWAAAKEAAGIAEEAIDAGTLAEALAAARGKAGPGGPAEQDERLRAVLARSSFLIDGEPVGSRARDGVVLEDASVIEVLPPFAGG
jgi:molybdopterin synthase sulfur carrier subunit